MTARTKKVVINLSALITAVVGAVAWGTPRLGAFVDTRFVHATTYTLDRMRDSLKREAEIREHYAEVKDIHRYLARLDSATRRRR